MSSIVVWQVEKACTKALALCQAEGRAVTRVSFMNRAIFVYPNED